MKGVPLFGRMVFGTSNLQMIFSLIKFATVGLVTFFKGIALTHFLLNSTVARIRLYPLDGEELGTIRSKAQV